jgi:sec-independent protein translocase protein TatA
MGTFGPMHWIIIAVLALLLFGGRGKLSGIMGDAAKGIKAFKEGMKDDPAAPTEAKKPEPAQPLPQAQKEEEPIVR